MSPGRPAFRDLNVLIVDDNQHMRNLILSVLRSFGIRNIKEASSADDAFEEFKQAPPDLIITDWHMSPVDGIELVRRVRSAKDSPNPYVPIVMLTGHADVRRVVDARDAGVNEFMAKPISATSLYTRIISIIERPRPFVRTETYFGPDRRRRDVGPPPGVSERRNDGRPAQATASQSGDEDATNGSR